MSGRLTYRYSSADVAQICGIARSTLRKWSGPSRGAPFNFEMLAEAFLALVPAAERHVDGRPPVPSRLYPQGLSDWDEIMVNPRLCRGQACVGERGIATRAIAKRFLAGEELFAVADDLRLSTDEVEAAIRFEMRRRS